MNIDFKLTVDNTQKIIEEKNQAVLRALEIIGQTVENDAAGLAPVDTGNLRNSITHDVDETSHIVAIGTNVEYAPYQELGTRRMEAANEGRGFLRPAVEDNIGKLQDILKQELSQ